MGAGAPERRPRLRRGLRLTLFAFGDFAFNLFWQSVMLFLLFYYTEALRLPVEVAALTFLVALIWDGIVSLAAGIYADRHHRTGGYRRYLLLGALPLGVAFLLAYLPPGGHGNWAAAAVLGSHLLFRTTYAMVNVPYLAMSARVTQDSGERALLAGLRMLFGTAALVVVTLGTVPIGSFLTGGSTMATTYFAAAAAFAALGAAILLWVGSSVPEVVGSPADGERPGLAASIASLARNRAFVTLNLATVAMVIAATVLTKSVLYYYKYQLLDEAAGQVALASMGVAGALAVPVWTIACRWLGGRATWFAASGLAVALLALFALAEVRAVPLMHGFLMAMQVALIGLNIVFWAMLPNTVEYGERSTGLRLEGIVFGLAALLQRVAIGIATAIFGLTLGAIGYRANVVQTPATLEGMRLAVALVPLAFLVASIVAMWRNPLRRGTHAALVAELRDGAAR